MPAALCAKYVLLFRVGERPIFYFYFSATRARLFLVYIYGAVVGNRAGLVMLVLQLLDSLLKF